jgi:hydrogenase maturation protease
VAWRVVEALRTAPPRPDAPGLRLRRVHQLAPELAESVSRTRAVVFVDARADGPAGAVRCEPVNPGTGKTPLSHALSPSAVLLYSERLFGQVPRAVVVTIGGARFDHGSELSPEVLAAVPKAAQMVRDLVCARTLDGAGPDTSLA